MEALLNRYRNLTLLVVVLLAQLVLLGYQVKTNQDVRLIRIWAVTAITPIANGVEVVRQNTIGVAENYFVLVNVREQNRKLNEEVGQLKLENHFLKTQLQTADRAKLLLAFQQQTPSRTLAARIIGNATGTNARVVFVDRGSTSGVMRGMAVVTPDGIVGKVIAAYPTASQVQLITDENFAAGVISDKHRVRGTLKGKGQNKPIVDYVQNEEEVDTGEIFYTSGDDRVFPKGLPVGPATVVKAGKSFKEIYVVPAAFQHGFEEVLIVLEGVHQGIPDRNAVSSSGYSMLPPPPPDAADTKAGKLSAAASPGDQDLRSGLLTEADRLRDKYKKIGEIEHHTYGEGLPGSKPPDFNINPNDPKFKAQPPQTAAAKPVPGAAAGAPETTTAAPKPASTSPAPAARSAAPVPPNPRPASSGTGTGAAPAVFGTAPRPNPANAGTTTGTTAPPPLKKPAPPPTGTVAAPAKPQTQPVPSAIAEGANTRNRTAPPTPSQPKPKRRPADDGSVEVLPIP